LIAGALMSPAALVAPAGAQDAERRDVDTDVTILDSEIQYDDRPASVEVDRRYISRRPHQLGSTRSIYEHRHPDTDIVIESSRSTVRDPYYELDPQEPVSNSPRRYYSELEIDNDDDGLDDDAVVIEDEPIHETRTYTVEPRRGVDVDVSVGLGHGDVRVDVGHGPATVYHEPEVTTYRHKIYHRCGPYCPEHGRSWVERRDATVYYEGPHVRVYREGRYYERDYDDEYWENEREREEDRREALEDLHEDLADADDDEDVREAWDDYYEELASIDNDD
jgi:hypothetical protein